MEPPSNKRLIGVVGPCGSGKSTLIAGLERHGYACRHIAHEHSYVQTMWQKIAKPDLLIYLSVSFPISTARRQLNWQKKDYDEQLRRLEHARQHANLLFDTDNLNPEQVFTGKLYSREVISQKQRELCAVASLTVLHRPRELRAHVHAALNVGATRQEVTEVIFQQVTYGGMPVVVEALDVLVSVLQERGEWEAGT